MKNKIEEMTALELLDVMECLSEYCHDSICLYCRMHRMCKKLETNPNNWNTENLLRALNEYLKVCGNEKEV